MKRADVEAFFAAPGSLDPEDYLELDFTFECAGDPRGAAAHLCSEQSTAQWARIGVEEDYRPRFGAKVLRLQAESAPAGFSLPLASAPAGPVHRCRVTIAHPHGNFGPRIPNLLSAVLGEGVFFAPAVPIIRLEDVRFPKRFLRHFAGPRFGIVGLRERLQVFGRPLFFGVIKPNVGLAPEPFAAIGEEALRGGLDIVKDDEMLADPAWSPVAERAALLGAACRRVEREGGEPKGYLANITDEVDRLCAQHDVVVGAGASAVMVNALPVGISALRMLSAHATVPVVTHFPMIAASARVVGYGVHPRVYTRLQRLAGADVIIMPGFGARMLTSEQEVLENVRACLEPMGALRPSLPVPGGSDSAATLARVHATLGTIDFGFVAGRGVFAHPMGPAAGARSLRQAWDAIAAGIPVDAHARAHAELAAALATFS